MSEKKTPAIILKSARQRKGWTQVETAQKAGMDSNTYAKIERGLNKPSIDSVLKLSKALSIDAGDLIVATKNFVKN